MDARSDGGPVNDVDRAIPFYRDQLGFALDHDTRAGDQRFAQLTPDANPYRTKPRGQITRIEPPMLWTMDARLAETPR